MAKEVKPKFIISENAWNTMQQYARKAHSKDGNEISGICLVKKTKHPVNDKPVWELFDPCILKQENSTTNTILDKDVLPAYYIDMAMKYGDNIRYCWWHSHHTMNAFWSTTDENEIEQWKNGTWSLALVINLFQDYCLNVSTWDPVEHSEDVPLEILRAVPEPSKEMLKEYKEKCSNIVHTTAYSGYTKTGYGYGTNQMSLISGGISSNIKLNWNAADTLEDYCKVFKETCEGLDDLNGEFITDKIQYKEYKKKVQGCNKKLKALNAKMSIKILTKVKLHAACMTDSPEDFIEYESKEVEMAYFSAQAAEEAVAYNGGWV